MLNLLISLLLALFICRLINPKRNLLDNSSQLCEMSRVLSSFAFECNECGNRSIVYDINAFPLGSKSILRVIHFQLLAR